MRASEMFGIGALLLLLIAQAAIALGLFAWGRWVARRHGGAAWRRAAWMPLLALALSMLGNAIVAALIARSFGALEGVDPSRKAAQLADSMSAAASAGTVPTLASMALYMASLVAFTAGSLLRPGGAPTSA